jgi:translocation and assembly module TamB
LNFDNPAVINPKFNMVSTADINEVKIRMLAYGEMTDWKVELSSNPAMPEQEILSLLALGFSSQDSQKKRGSDIQQGEAASLLLHSFDFNRDVKEKTGFQIELDKSVNTQSGSSIFKTETQTEASPKVVIKRKIGKKLEVSAGSTVGVGTTSELEVNAEVKDVVPGVSVIGVWDSFEGVQTQESQTSYGVDLKYQKRFK